MSTVYAKLGYGIAYKKHTFLLHFGFIHGIINNHSLVMFTFWAALWLSCAPLYNVHLLLRLMFTIRTFTTFIGAGTIRLLRKWNLHFKYLIPRWGRGRVIIRLNFHDNDVGNDVDKLIIDKRLKEVHVSRCRWPTVIFMPNYEIRNAQFVQNSKLMICYCNNTHGAIFFLQSMHTLHTMLWQCSDHTISSCGIWI